MNEYRGSLDASGKRFALIASRFNEALVQNLVQGATDCLGRLGAEEADVDLYWVGGAFETPFVARAAAASGKYDAVIALGVVVRGDTLHFELVAGEAARGLARVGYETGVPTVLGILAADTYEQAADRAGGKRGNRGWDAAEVAVEMVNLGEAFASDTSKARAGAGAAGRRPPATSTAAGDGSGSPRGKAPNPRTARGARSRRGR
jgi:6,7-dimethyl-8-ribityllumazine synthase